MGHVYTFYLALLTIATLCFLVDLAVTRYNAFSSEEGGSEHLPFNNRHNFSDEDIDMEDKQSLLKKNLMVSI